MVDRKDWLLTFIGAPGSDRFHTDQIRVMKGLFLLSKEGPPGLRDLYGFEPYDYGPFNKLVYRDLGQLEAEGLIDSTVMSGSKRRIFRVTARGAQRCEDIRASADPAMIKELDGVKELVSSMGFMDLLRYVYDRHPDFAVSSVVNRGGVLRFGDRGANPSLKSLYETQGGSPRRIWGRFRWHGEVPGRALYTAWSGAARSVGKEGLPVARLHGALTRRQ